MIPEQWSLRLMMSFCIPADTASLAVDTEIDSQYTIHIIHHKIHSTTDSTLHFQEGAGVVDLAF